MADRILIKNGDRPDPGPGPRRAAARRRPHRGRHDRGRRAEPVRGRRPGHRRRRRHRHPGLHRHPPPHVGDVDPDVRPGLRADHLLRLDPRQVRARTTGPTTSTRPTCWGALECINAGITTLVDWSHIMNTPDHADAAIQGLQESGIRSVFAYGFGNTSLQRLVVRAGLHRQRADLDGADARRIRKQYFNSDDGLITMALATRGPNFCKPDVVAPRLGAGQGARHQHHGPRRDGPLRLHEDADHRACATWTCCTRTRPTSTPRTSPTRSGRWSRDSGGNVSFAPQIEIQMGHGWAPAVTAPEYGVPIGLSLGRRHHGVVRPVHPDALDLRLGARPQAPGRRGTRTSTGSRRRPDLITSRQVLDVGDAGRRQGRRDRRPDRARSRRARRPTS